MCFGGKPTVPQVPAPPAPSPVPTPSEVSPVNTPQQQANQVRQLQYGVLSTIKTAAGGVAGTGPDLVPNAAGGQTAKKTLGS